MAPPAKMPTRKLGKNGPEVAAIGFGLMSMASGVYGTAGYEIATPLVHHTVIRGSRESWARMWH